MATATAIDQLCAMLENVAIVDLSTDVAEHTDGPFKTRMDVIEAGPGADIMAREVVPGITPSLAGSMSAADFPDGEFLRHETVTASLHAGSHVDAPGHYGGDPARGMVNDADPRLFVAPGFVIDTDGSALTRADVLAAAGSRDLHGTIVLLRLGADGRAEPAAVEKLLDRGADVIGTDARSFDGSFADVLGAYAGSGDPGVLWPCHVLGRGRPYYQIESLANLDRLPREGFLVFAPPVLVSGATAAWARVLALIPHEERS